MFKGDPLATGEAARKIADQTRLNEKDLDFIQSHCVINTDDAPGEVPPRNCCLRDCKIYVCMLIFFGILGLLLYYYVF